MGSRSAHRNSAGADSCRLRGSFFNPSVFNDFRIRGDFFDINLFTDEGSIPAHRVILSACSDFFKDRLRQMQPSWNPSDPLQYPAGMTSMYLMGVSQSDLSDILEFIYNGDVSIRLDHLDDFLLVAQRLKIKGLISEDVEEVGTKILEVTSGIRRGRGLKRSVPHHSDRRMFPVRKIGRVDPPNDLQQDSDMEDVKNIIPVIAVGSDGVETAVVGHEGHEGHETVSVGPDGSVIKVQTEVVGQELIEGDDVQEVDVRDMRFEIGEWHLEVESNMEGGVVGDLIEADTGEVLVNGQKAKNFIKKIDKVFHCTLCDHSSKDKSNLVRHVKRRHTNPSYELCPHCGRTYKNKECLYNHLSTKRCMRGINFDPKDPRILTYIRFDSTDNKWACVECDAKYRQKCNAREHVAIKHIGIQSFVSHEDALTVEEPSVAKYIEYVPTKNKWKCLSCGRLFSTSFNVSHHIKQKHQRKMKPHMSESDDDDQE